MWYSARLDLLISARHRQGAEAFYLAESGWNRLLAETSAGTGPSERLLEFPQGSVRVEVATLTGVSPDTVIYALTSTGYRVGGAGFTGARRSVRLLVVEDGSGQLLPWPGTWREVW